MKLFFLILCPPPLGSPYSSCFTLASRFLGFYLAFNNPKKKKEQEKRHVESSEKSREHKEIQDKIIIVKATNLTQ